MNDQLKLVLAMLAILIVFGIAYGHLGNSKTNESANVTNNTAAMGTLDYEAPCYQTKCKTFNSELGFSFQYPEDMEVMSLSLPGDNYRIAVKYTDDFLKKYKDQSFGMIIISAGFNDEKMSPVEWLSGPDSGYDPSEKYYQTEIDGQEAVRTAGSMWHVVNTPDNKWRLSITDLTQEGENPPFSEMGYVINSLKFDR